MTIPDSLRDDTAQHPEGSSVRVSPLLPLATLANRLHDANLVILDATLAPPGSTPPIQPGENYLARHLPGAVFFDIDELSDHTSGLPHTLPCTPPAIDRFARAMSALGVGDAMEIVIYEQHGVFSAPRARWMLQTLGARRVSVLDGDLAAWVAAGFPTETGPVQRPPATFHAQLSRDAYRTYAEVQTMIAGREQNGMQLFDARSAGRFDGRAPEPRPGLPSGHMPGAVSLPFTDLLAAGHLRDPEALRQLFATKGLNLHEPVTTTCGSGVTAAVVALALELAGAEHISLYDGSWAEYAAQPGAAIESA